jgi:glycosyltransferase involved in cell wall biosynthesis
MKCSVVVATFNRAEGLRRLLEALANQDIPMGDFEVIVVDDGSTDHTQDVLAGLRMPYRLKTLWQRNHGAGVARNAAIEAAEGPIIVTLDDDVEPAPDLLRRHLDAHSGPEDIAAIGRMVYPDGAKLEPWVRWEYAGLTRQHEAMREGRWQPTPRQFYTANTSLPRSVYERAGFFDPLYRRAEDVEIAFRFMDLGVQFRYLPDAVIHHTPRRTFSGWQRMAWQYGFYDIMMSRQPGRDYVFKLMGHEFLNRRSPLLQRLARLLVHRRLALGSFLSAAGAAARVAGALHQQRLAMGAYSLIFGLQYLRGAAEAIGEPRALLRKLEATAMRIDLNDLSRDIRADREQFSSASR